MQKLVTTAGLSALALATKTMDTKTVHDSDSKLLKQEREIKKLDTKLTVHFTPHTHDDVGWLKTVDEYYSGIDNSIQRVEVMLILDEVIPELLADDKKRFSYVEMKFFEMWWRNQSDDLKASVRDLVSSGRLEILNAGWSMHDEACPHYEDMINNM